MSPSVNHPLSSRAALVPAMLVGAAVALALLAIPSAAASGGPGEWLLTGLENRWKWGADWTPEFGPWAWLVFAPATAETWLWQLGFALAGGGCSCCLRSRNCFIHTTQGLQSPPPCWLCQILGSAVVAVSGGPGGVPDCGEQSGSGERLG